MQRKCYSFGVKHKAEYKGNAKDFDENAKQKKTLRFWGNAKQRAGIFVGKYKAKYKAKYKGNAMVLSEIKSKMHTK